MTLQDELTTAQAELAQVDEQISSMAHGPIPPEVSRWSTALNTPVPDWTQKLNALQERRADLLAQVTDCQHGIAQGVL